MAEVDPVIVQMRLDQQRFIEEIRRTQRAADRSFDAMEKNIKDLERQIRSSSSTISGSLRGLAGTFAAAFSVQQVAALADSFTRLQNSLSVAGLEGQGLADVQQRLLELSGANGVSIEGLAGLYGGIARAQKELGATSEQVLALTQATAESLRITGTSAAQSSGAILGLTQALAGGTVRAEEYNQILEGGLQPLLQAVANTDKYGGSLARLRAAVNDGTVSSQELYQGVLANAAGITETASRATLTLAGSLEALRSQFVVFIGQADASLGATAAVTNGLKLLGENIGIVAGAVAVLATVMGVRLVAAAGASAVSFYQARAAAVAYGIALNGVAITARAAGTALLIAAAPAAAIIAVGAALAYMAVQSQAAEESAERFAESQGQSVTQLDALIAKLEAAGVATDDLRAASDAAKVSVDGVTAAYMRGAEAAAELARQSGLAAIQMAQTNIVQAQDRRREAQRRLRGFNPNVDSDATRQLRGEIATANAVETANRAIIVGTARGARAGVSVGATPTGPTPAPAATGRARTSRASRTGRQGPSQEEIAARAAREEAAYLDALASLHVDALRITADINGGLTAKRDADLAAVTADRLSFDRQMALDEALNDAQRQKVAAFRDAVDDARRTAIEQETNIELAQRAAQLAASQIESDIEIVRDRAELADNSRDRLDAELALIDLSERAHRAELERVLATERTNSIEAEIAQAKLDQLEAATARAKDEARLRYASPLERYGTARSAGATRDRVEELVVDELDNVRDGISDALSKAIGTDDPLIKGLLDLLIEEILLKPIAAALSQAGGQGSGAGGFLSAATSIFSSLFGGGKASGGYVGAGKMYRVNEGASPGRVEGFMPTGSGKILPLGQMNALAGGGGQSGGGGVVRIVIEEAEGFAAKVQTISAGVALEVHKVTRAGIVSEAVGETQRQFGRTRL